MLVCRRRYPTLVCHTASSAIGQRKVLHPIGYITTDREALHITIVVTEHGADTVQRLLGPIRDGKCQLGAPTVGAGLGPKPDAWHGLAFHIRVCEAPVRLDLPYIVA